MKTGAQYVDIKDFLIHLGVRAAKGQYIWGIM